MCHSRGRIKVRQEEVSLEKQEQQSSPNKYHRHMNTADRAGSSVRIKNIKGAIVITYVCVQLAPYSWSRYTISSTQ